MRTFPDLKSQDGAISDLLRARGASAHTLDFWRDIARSPLALEDDETDSDVTE